MPKRRYQQLFPRETLRPRVEMYTVIVWDSEALHMLIHDMTGDNLDGGIVAMPYKAPFEFAKYSVSLFEQTAPITVNNINRIGFDKNAFVSKYGLLPAGEESIQLENR
jgi:hypothetical protein